MLATRNFSSKLNENTFFCLLSPHYHIITWHTLNCVSSYHHWNSNVKLTFVSLVMPKRSLNWWCFLFFLWSLRQEHNDEEERWVTGEGERVDWLKYHHRGWWSERWVLPTGPERSSFLLSSTFHILCIEFFEKVFLLSVIYKNSWISFFHHNLVDFLVY